MRSIRRGVFAAIAAGCALLSSQAVLPAAATPPAASSGGLSIPGGGGIPAAGSVTSSGPAVVTGRPQAQAAPAGAMSPAQVQAAPAPNPYPVRGIDVSSYQGNVNWAAVASAGARFAYVKATEGTTYTNPYFAQQYGGSKAAGLYTGAYAFARPDANNPVQQAQYFLAHANFVRDGRTLPPLLDLEWPYSGISGQNSCWNQTPAGMVAWISAFVGTVQAATAQPMVIYTSPYWWNPCTGSSTAFGRQLLDVPKWSRNPPTVLPAGWSKWTFWQNADSGALPGDQDVFGGNLSQLAALAKPGLAPGTSPSMTALRGGGYEIAYQAVTGSLVTLGTAGYRVWGLGMMSGTSPSNAGLANGSYEVAFQANNGSLWTVGSYWRAWGLGMMAGTSPSVAGLTNGSFEVAFQANNGSLWTVGASNRAWGLGMMSGTSPSVAGLANGRFEVAFQANNGGLWTVGASNRAWGLGMMAGTSPSVAPMPYGNFEVAFQANSGALWTVGANGHGSWGLGMMSGTSPSIAALPSGRYQVAFQANVGVLWTAG